MENRYTPPGAETFSSASLTSPVDAEPIPGPRPDQTLINPDSIQASPDKKAEVLELLQQGVEAVTTEEGFKAWLRMQSKFHRYSFNNVLLIGAQRPDATLVNSYNRWQELGRQVQKGEGGIKIFFPKHRIMEVEDEDTGKVEKRKMLTGFGIGNVFDISQTEGETLPEPPPVDSLSGVSSVSAEVNLKLSRYLIDEGVTLKSEYMDGHKQGYWHPEKNLIAIRKSTMVPVFSVGRTRTLAHEAAHREAGHKAGVDRSEAEAVADSTAYVVMHHFGMDVGNASFPYIAGWAPDVKVLKSNLQAISETSKRLIAGIEGVTDPYEDDFGSWESRDEDAGIHDQLEEERLADLGAPDWL